MTHFVTTKLKAASPYSQSRAHEAARLPKETGDAYEQRTWRERVHVKDGAVCIPAMALKMAVDTAAKRLGLQIPGRGKATYTKHFLSGCLMQRDVPLLLEGLSITVDDLECDRIYANADGVRGSGKRVWRYYPRVDQWHAEAIFTIADPAITQEVFSKALTEAGQFIGIGRFRSENGGLYGRFTVESIAWGQQ